MAANTQPPTHFVSTVARERPDQLPGRDLLVRVLADCGRVRRVQTVVPAFPHKHERNRRRRLCRRAHDRQRHLQCVQKGGLETIQAVRKQHTRSQVSRDEEDEGRQQVVSVSGVDSQIKANSILDDCSFGLTHYRYDAHCLLGSNVVYTHSFVQQPQQFDLS